MSDYTLTGGPRSIGLNESNTVGAFVHEGITNNQTKSGYYTAGQLVDWAKAVQDTYGEDEAVEVVFTPQRPMVATGRDPDTEMKIGIGVAPMLEPDAYAELKAESE